MCLPAIGTALTGGALTAGSGAGLFAASLGLNLATGLAGRAAAQAAADQQYQSALIANRSAERDKRLKQQALAEQKRAKEVQSYQNIFARNIEALQANRAIIASEQAGTTIGLLLMDNERQSANYRESINQSLESFRRQYDRNILVTEAEFENRRNDLQSSINDAYNQIPTLGQTLLNIGTGALNQYSLLS